MLRIIRVSVLPRCLIVQVEISSWLHSFHLTAFLNLAIYFHIWKARYLLLFPLPLLPLPIKRSSRLCSSPATKNTTHIIGKFQLQKQEIDSYSLYITCTFSFTYCRYSSTLRAQIGSYADIHGTSAASRYFPRKLGKKVTKSSVQSIKKAYVREKRKTDEELTDLPEKKREQPLLLGDTVDAQLQVYLKKVRDQGGAVTASVAVAAAMVILKATNRSSLLEYGGYVSPTKDSAYHFLARMKFVRQQKAKFRHQHLTNWEMPSFRKYPALLQWRRFLLK